MNQRRNQRESREMYVRILVHVGSSDVLQTLATGIPIEPSYLDPPQCALGYELGGPSVEAIQDNINQLMDTIAGLIGEDEFHAHPV